MPGEVAHAKSGIKPKIAGGVSMLVGPDETYVQPTGQADGSADVTDVAAPTGANYVTSPLTGVGVTQGNHILEIPAGAKYLYLTAAAAIRYSDQVAHGGYAYLPAYTESLPIPCTDKVQYYLRINAASGTTTVWYRFDDRV